MKIHSWSGVDAPQIIGSYNWCSTRTGLMYLSLSGWNAGGKHQENQTCSQAGQGLWVAVWQTGVGERLDEEPGNLALRGWQLYKSGPDKNVRSDNLWAPVCPAQIKSDRPSISMETESSPMFSLLRRSWTKWPTPAGMQRVSCFWEAAVARNNAGFKASGETMHRD